MLPSLPNNIYNIIFTIGIFLIGFSFIQNQNLEDKMSTLNAKIISVLGNMNDRIDQLNREENYLKYRSKDLAQAYQIDNPMSFTDSTYTFTTLVNGNNKTKIVEKEISKLYSDYKTNKDEFQKIRKNLLRSNELMERQISSFKVKTKLFDGLLVVGLIMSLIGTVLLLNGQVQQDKITRGQLNASQLIDCQSCNRRFNATVNKAPIGTSDVSTHYCTICFDGSKFTNANLTLDQAFNAFMTSTNNTWLNRLYFKDKFKNLRRWKHGEY